MRAIVSVTDNWGIGKDGKLLVRNPVDMHFFKYATMGGTVICGRSTFESFPHGALVGRRNIVLTSSEDFCADGVEVAHSLDELFELIAGDNPDSVWVIGGQSVYEQLLDQCSEVLVTKHDTSFKVNTFLPCSSIFDVAEAQEIVADRFFPNLDAYPESWKISSCVFGGITSDGFPFWFCVYRWCG